MIKHFGQRFTLLFRKKIKKKLENHGSLAAGAIGDLDDGINKTNRNTKVKE